MTSTVEFKSVFEERHHNKDADIEAMMSNAAGGHHHKKADEVGNVDRGNGIHQRWHTQGV